MPRSGPLTSQTIIQIGGSSGPLLQSSSGTVEVRNAANTFAANFRASAIAGLSSVKSQNASDCVQRQRVLNGPIDSGRQASALTNGGGLVVLLSGSVVPIVVCFGAGYDSTGANNLVSFINYNLSYVLPANSTSYLYLDRSISTGVIATGFSSLAPTESRFFEGNPAVDQHWFDSTENLMKRWDGSAWVTVQRIFMGLCVTGAATITSLVNYPYFQQGILHQWHHLSRSYEQKVRASGGTIREKRLQIIDELLIWELAEVGLLNSLNFLWIGGSDTFAGANLTIIKRDSESEPTLVNALSGNFASDGLQGNGTSYINLNHVPSAWYTTGLHFSVAFSRGRRGFRPNASGSEFAHGVEQGFSQKVAFGSSGDDSAGSFAQWVHVLGDIFYKSNVRGPGGYYVNILNPPAQAEYWLWPNDDMRGCHTINRVTTYMSYHHNRQQYVQMTPALNANLNSYSIPTLSPFVLACNVNGAAARHSEKTVRFVSMGPGLSNTQVIQKQAIIQRWMQEFN